MKRLMVVLCLCSVVGCGGVMNVSSDHATLTGSPEGIRAMFDGMTGLIIDGKASPDKRTAHTKMRENQEREFTKRAMVPGFLSNLLSRQSATAVTNIDNDSSKEIE